MAFNLKKVLKALLLSSNQPLAIKDIQAAFTRFHDRASEFLDENEQVEGGEGEPSVEGAAPPEAAPAAESAPVAAEAAPGAEPTSAAALEAPPADAPGDAAPATSTDSAPAEAASAAPASEVTEILLESGSHDPELYSEVPSLITGTQIREAMDQIAADLRTADEGMLLIEGNAGYRLVTHPRFARWVRILRQEPPPVKLTQSAVETLAVIAYRQPVTRGEIETIRGVSAEAGINKLLEREMIYIVGRADAPGRPIQYGTTDGFLEFVGIKSLDELPASDVLSSRQIDEWLKTNSTSHKPNDTDMGLADEQLPLEAPVPPPHQAPAAEPAADAGQTAAEPAQN